MVRYERKKVLHLPTMNTLQQIMNKFLKIDVNTCTVIYDSTSQICNVPQMRGLPDHVPSLWQNLSLVVVFRAYPLMLLQTKQALEPVMVPL